MKSLEIIAYPYAAQQGVIEVPEGLSPEKEHDYIVDHWNEIDFGSPELDYEGIDFEVYEME